MTPAQASSLNAASYMIRRMLLHAGISGFSSPSISFEGIDGAAKLLSSLARRLDAAGGVE